MELYKSKRYNGKSISCGDIRHLTRVIYLEHNRKWETFEEFDERYFFFLFKTSKLVCLNMGMRLNLKMLGRK